MQSIMDEIEEITSICFSINFNNMDKRIIILLEEIDKNCSYLSNNNKWIEMLNNILRALTDKDYLLITDILNYEIKPLIHTV